MEIKVLSNFTSHWLWNYFRTRFPAWLVVALPLLVIAPTLLLRGYSSRRELGVGFGMALLLIIEFRLWDDLCDRKQDCLEDPRRVLCQAPSIRPFLAVLLLIATSNMIVLALQSTWWPLAFLAALHALLALWYVRRERLALGPVANYHVILLKYPVFGLILSVSARPEFTLALYASLAVVYLGLCIVEVLHDQRLCARRSAWICMFAESVLLTCIVIAWTSRTLFFGWPGEGIS